MKLKKNYNNLIYEKIKCTTIIDSRDLELHETPIQYVAQLVTDNRNVSSITGTFKPGETFLSIDDDIVDYDTEDLQLGFGLTPNTARFNLLSTLGVIE